VRDQVSGEVPPGFARPWDSLRWLREPLAWTLLALAALIVLVSACQLFHLAGATIPVAQPVAVTSSAPAGPAVPVGSTPPPQSAPAPSNPAPVSIFSLRASSVAPQFSDVAVQGLPVLAVILVAFGGGLAERARQVVQTAAAVLAAAFVLDLISLVGAAGAHVRPGTWYILEALGLAITAVALAFTCAVLWSRPFRTLRLRFNELVDDEDGYGDDPDFGEPD
jgi:hypothetical protein